MKRSPKYRWLRAGLAAVVLLSVTTLPSWAGEEPKRFLDGLRQLGYHDVALDYLEQMRTSPLVGTDFKATIDYERGITLATGSHLVPSSQRGAQLDQAQASLQKFLAEHAGHPLASGTNSQLANLLVERGKLKIQQADKPDNSAEVKERLREEARTLYREAEKVFGGLEVRFRADLAKYPKGVMDPKKEAKQIEERDELRKSLVGAKLSQAQVVEELARTHDPGSTQNKELLTDAVKKYGKLYDDYATRSYVGGFYARLWQARCYKELAQFDEAFDACEDLIELEDDSPSVRTLKSRALLVFLQTALVPEAKKTTEAIAKFKAWEKWARPNEESSLEGLAVKYFAGELMLQYARSLKTRETAKTRSDNLKAAERLFIYVGRHQGDYQREANAKLRLPEFGGGEGGDGDPPPADFVEARQRGRDALDQSEDQDLSEEERAEYRRKAIKYLQAAMRLRTPETTTDEMNYIRYHLAYLYWANGNLYEAAVAGEFLARRYPGSAVARKGAMIAMFAYYVLLSEIPVEEDRRFETQRMDAIADHITQVWKDQPEADEAWMMRTRIAVQDRDAPKALEHSGHISEESPRRGEAALIVGQMLWSDCVTDSRLPEDQRPSDEELQKRIELAKSTLQDGVTRLRQAVEQGADVTDLIVNGVLSLVQASIRVGEAEEAVQFIEDEKIGILPLVDASHKATQRENVPQEIYKTALRTYVAAQQVDKAEGVMEKLEESLGDAGGARLTGIYIGLSKQLQETLLQLRADGKVQEAAAMAGSFEAFLNRIAQREQGNTFGSLGWVADNLYKLGTELDSPGQELPEAAKRCYQRSAGAFQKILDLCKADEKFAPKAGADLGIKVRLARCLRAMGEYKKAMDLLVEVIEAKPLAISVQVEAARTYQEWGEVKPGYYLLAIRGGSKDKKTKVYRVWGWIKIGNRAIRSTTHEKIFYDARYNVALCRFGLAQGKSGDERKKTLAQAEKDVLDVYRLYPTMGGKESYDKYDKLLTTIQKLRGTSSTGLKGTARRRTPPKKAG